MKSPKHIEIIFEKYIANTLSKEEFNVFLEHVKNPEYNEEINNLFDKYHSSIDKTKVLSENIEYDSDLIFYKISNKIEEGKETNFPKFNANYFFKIAATIVLFLSAGYYFYQDVFIGKQGKVTSSPIEELNAITLTLSDGSVKVISENANEEIVDKKAGLVGVQKGNQISYSNAVGKTHTEELVYNELFVPYGRLFDLELSDGTKIKLNAGSSIKYPIKFIEGLDRKVFIKGEAFFDVAEDKNHPFIVYTNDVNVEVLGTEFNVSSYPEDSNINTVLVEGSVKLYGKGDLGSGSELILSPSHKASWNVFSKEITVDKVDTDVYTAWKKGILLFRKSSFFNLSKKLERQFDVVIENKYSFLNNQVYTATFNSEDNTVEDILDAFKEDTPFSYTRKENTITITKL